MKNKYYRWNSKRVTADDYTYFVDGNKVCVIIPVGRGFFIQHTVYDLFFLESHIKNEGIIPETEERVNRIESWLMLKELRR